MVRGSQRIVRGIGAFVTASAVSMALHAQSPGRLAPTLFHDPITAEAALTHDDNANRGRDSEQRLADDVLSLTFSQPREWQFGRHVRLEATGILAGDKFRRYSGLDRISAGVKAQLQYRASGAFDATTWSLVASAAYDEFDSHLRSGARYFLGASAQHAFTDRIELFAQAGRAERTGHSDVFNGRDDRVLLTLVYTLGMKDLMYLTGEHRRGDTVSTGGPSLANADIAQVLVPDDAFGQALIAYRFRARTVLSTLGWNHALGPRDSVDVSWRRIDARPLGHPGIDFPGELRYIANQYAIVYLRRF